MRGSVARVAAVTVAQGVAVVAQAFAVTAVVVAVVTGAGLSGPLTALAVVTAMRALLAYVLERSAGRAAVRVSTALRARLVTDSLARPAGMPEGPVPLTLATAGVTSVEPYVARFLPALVAAAAVPALAIGTLLVVDPWSALVVVLTLPLLPVFAALIGQHTAEATRRRWAALAGLAGHFLDVMRGLPTLAAYGRAWRQARTVGEVSERHRLASMRTLRLAFLSTAALELLSTICVAIVAVVVGVRLAAGTMELATGLVAILLAPEAYWPVRRVGAEYHAAADGAAALQEALDRLDRPVPAAPPAAGSVVDVSDVAFAYPGADPVVAGVSATLTTGLTVILGPSGAGKSTFLGIVAGVLTPTEGHVSAPAAHWVTQSPFLAPASVAENLRLGTAADPPAMWAALRDVGMDGFVAGLPDGIDTVLGDEGVGLSAGQRARLALARALLSSAPVVLLDEPTAHLDESAAALAHAAIGVLARHRVVVAVTHRPELAALADARVVLAPAARTSDRAAALPTRAGDTGRGGIASPAAAAPAGRPAALADSHGEPDGSDPNAGTSQRQLPGTREPATPAASRRRLVVATLIGAAASTAGVALTATSAWLIVSASAQPQILTLLTAIVGVRAFGIARPALRYLERLRSHDAALIELADRRVRLYQALVPLTPARLGRRSRGERLSAAVADLDDEVDGLVRGTVPLGGLAVTAVVATVGVALVLPAAGLAMVGLLVAGAVAGWWGYRGELRGHRDELAARADVTRLSLLACTDAASVQAAQAGHRLLQWLAAAQDRLVEATGTRAAARGASAAAVLAAAGAGAGTTAVLAAGSGLGAPVAALLVLTPVAVGDLLLGLADGAGARARAHAAGSRLRELVAQPPALAADGRVHRSLGGAPVPAGLPWETHVPELVVDRAVAEWAPGRRVGPLSLRVAPGEHVAVLGPNGAGKSTVLALLARHLDPVAGMVTADGIPLRELGLDSWREQVALVDDEPHLFAGTLRANLLLAAPGASDEEVRAALTSAGLGGWLAGLPDGLDTGLGAGGRGVSGGERARLAIARALVSGRPVVLLDEPVAHLDHPTAVGVLTELTHSCAGRSVVMATHRPDGLGRFDRLVRPRPDAGVRADGRG